MSRTKIIFLILGILLVSVLSGGQSQPKLKIETADSESEMHQGLSGRANLPGNTGMLFVYRDDVTPSFWMKDMHFPLDIIWLDQNKRIVGWEKTVAPDTYPATFSPPRPIRYVLEVNAGFVDKHDLKVGDKAYN